jgi:WD40 repeat protein
MGTFILHSVKKWSFDPGRTPEAVGLAESTCETAIVDSNKHLSCFDKTGNEKFSIPLPTKAFNVSISNLGKYIAVLCEDKRIRVYNNEGQFLWEAHIDIGATTLDINQKDGYLIIGSNRKKIYIFRLDGKPINEIKTENPVFDICFAPAANGFVTLSAGGNLDFYDYESVKHWHVPINKQCRSVDVSFDGKFIIVPVYEEGIYAYNWQGDFIGEYDVQAEVSTASINSSGNLIYLADEKNRLILLNRNAEVIWDKEMPQKIISLKTDDTGAVCVLFMQGGKIDFLELVAEESSTTEFLEVDDELHKLQPILLWKKDFSPILDWSRPVESFLSPGGGYIVVKNSDRISAYRENSLLLWNHFFKDPNIIAYPLKQDNFFFVNTSKELHKFSYRKGLEWSLRLEFDKLYTPAQRGNLCAISKNSIFSITNDAEIQWEKKLDNKPSKIALSKTGNLFAFRAAQNQLDIYNSSGGLALKINIPVDSPDFSFFNSYIVYIRNNTELIGTGFPKHDKAYFKAAEAILKIEPVGNFLILHHDFGAITVLNQDWKKVFDLRDDKGYLITGLDSLGDPLYIKAYNNALKLFNRTGEELWYFETEKRIEPRSLCYSNDKLIIFIKSILHYFSLTGKEPGNNITKYLEFKS